MLKKKFYFIVFEGVEGTGKSYQINKLYKKLKSKNFNVIKTREPGGSPTGEIIRDVIFSKKLNQFDKLTAFYLMCAARNEHVKKLLLNAKKQKKIVLCDRFTDSTFAYQVIGNNINRSINEINQKYILKKIKPNLTIILKSDFKTIVSRIKKRKVKNKFDNLKISFYKKAQKAYLSKAENNKNYKIFNSSANDNVLEKELFKLIIKKLH